MLQSPHNQNNTEVVFSQYFGSLIGQYRGSSVRAMNYGERLRYARKFRSLKQDQLAAASGVKQGTISKIERGDQSSSKFDIALAKALRIRVEWLALDEGPMELDDNTDLDARNTEAIQLAQNLTPGEWALLKEWGEQLLARRLPIPAAVNEATATNQPHAGGVINSRGIEATSRQFDEAHATGVLHEDKAHYMNFTTERGGGAIKAGIEEKAATKAKIKAETDEKSRLKNS